MRPIHLLLMLFVTLAWGLNFLAVRLAVVELPPILATALRFVVVLVILLPVLRPVAGQMGPLLRVAALLGVLHFGAIYLGVAVADGISEVAIAAQTTVPFSTMMAIVFLGERVGWKRVAGIVLSFSGVMVMGLDPDALDKLEGLAFVLFAALIYAIASVMMRNLRGVGAMTLQAWVALCGVPGLLALSWFFESGQVAAVANISWTAAIAVLYTAVGASIIGHGGMYLLLQRYPVTQVSPFTLMAPVFAVISGVVFLDETLDARTIAGGLLTLTGVGIILLRNRRRTPLPESRSTAEQG